jgi:hypothetical protein
VSDTPESRTQREAPAPPDNPTDSLYEEAKRCPRCKQTGLLVRTHQNEPRPGAKIEVYQCDNELCITHRDRWIIQVNADGSIPQRQAGPKEFEVNPKAMDMGKAIVEQTKHQLDRGNIEPGSA